MELLAQLRELGIVSSEEPTSLRAVEDLARQFAEPRALARQLIQRDILTPYQANQLLTGKGKALVVGRYLIIDRLGEGGMGKVFKARDQKLHRVVALKVIHPERLANKLAVERFQREIQAVARLSHANIVWAFDADMAGGVHYFAMQYVPGIDLARLVRESGPLDVVRACDYIRQAALGLQHIADHGMVHRDIKPSNLLIATGKPSPSKGESGVLATAVNTHVVKIVDLGLTREPEHYREDPEKQLTQSGTMMGTPDYMAPEQARDSHLADIRSDIYSLGCTLFYALVGRPPFGGESYVQKIMHHQLDPVEGVDQLRPGIPPALSAVIRRMMAKKPEDRYQVPAEVAQVLEPFAAGSFIPVALPVGNPPPASVPTEASKPTEPMFQFAETAIERLVTPISHTPRAEGYWDKWLWAWIAGGFAALLVFVILLLRLIFR